MRVSAAATVVVSLFPPDVWSLSVPAEPALGPSSVLVLALVLATLVLVLVLAGVWLVRRRRLKAAPGLHISFANPSYQREEPLVSHQGGPARHDMMTRRRGRGALKGTVPAHKRSSNPLKRLRKIFAMPVRPRSATEIRYNIIFPP